MGIVWIAYPFWAYFAESNGNCTPALLMWGFSFFNALVGHSLSFVLLRTYNPGAWQSLFMLVPIGVLVMREIAKKEGSFLVLVLIYSAWGHGFGLLLPGYLMYKGYIN